MVNEVREFLKAVDYLRKSSGNFEGYKDVLDTILKFKEKIIMAEEDLTEQIDSIIKILENEGMDKEELGQVGDTLTRLFDDENNFFDEVEEELKKYNQSLAANKSKSGGRTPTPGSDYYLIKDRLFNKTEKTNIINELKSALSAINRIQIKIKK